MAGSGRARAAAALRGPTMRADVLGAVAAGGAVGAVARHAVTEVVGVHGRWPWATWVENVSGAFLLGALLTALLVRRPGSRRLRPFLAAGVLGSYTTFSALAVEANLLGRADDQGLALAYIVATVAAGLLAARLGVVCASRWDRRRLGDHGRATGPVGP